MLLTYFLVYGRCTQLQELFSLERHVVVIFKWRNHIVSALSWREWRWWHETPHWGQSRCTVCDSNRILHEIKSFYRYDNLHLVIISVVLVTDDVFQIAPPDGYPSLIPGCYLSGTEFETSYLTVRAFAQRYGFKFYAENVWDTAK